MVDKVKGRSIADQKAMDGETTAMLFEGASLSQLVQLFGQDIRKIKAKLHGLHPVKTRAGHPIYSVKEAARYLAEPAWPIDEYIKRMNHMDLPFMLKKEYWAGMRSRQIYEQAAGDLWPTVKVVGHVTEILKTISLSLKLADDAVEREVRLSPQQRDIVRRIMDETLQNAHDALHRFLEEAKTNQQESADGRSSQDNDDDTL